MFDVAGGSRRQVRVRQGVLLGGGCRGIADVFGEGAVGPCRVVGTVGAVRFLSGGVGHGRADARSVAAVGGRDGRRGDGQATGERDQHPEEPTPSSRARWFPSLRIAVWWNAHGPASFAQLSRFGTGVRSQDQDHASTCVPPRSASPGRALVEGPDLWDAQTSAPGLNGRAVPRVSNARLGSASIGAEAPCNGSVTQTALGAFTASLTVWIWLSQRAVTVTVCLRPTLRPRGWMRLANEPVLRSRVWPWRRLCCSRSPSLRYMAPTRATRARLTPSSHHHRWWMRSSGVAFAEETSRHHKPRRWCRARVREHQVVPGHGV